jgi:hypothetical protein
VCINYNMYSRREEPASFIYHDWNCALAAFHHAGTRLAAFRAEEAAIPWEKRTFAVENHLDERFSRLECARLAALARLLRVPAPDLPTLAVKIDLIIDEAAWELSDAETCLAALKSDARRLCHGS